MKNIGIKKTIIFILSVFFFACVSVIGRNILVNQFNGHDFGIFQIDYIKNYGAAFSLFNNHTSLLITISIVILFMTLYYVIKNLNNFSKSEFVFSSLLCSGIVCNLVERLSDGFVTDYIRLNFVMFPIFNISDLFICIGAFMLICNILFSNDKQSN